MRRPSPDFTTALATRKATTTRSTLALAKPAKALAGSTVRVSTAADTANSEAVRSGNAFRMTEKIAAANTAKRCQALFRQPGWDRREPDAERQAERQDLFEQAAEAVWL